MLVIAILPELVHKWAEHDLITNWLKWDVMMQQTLSFFLRWFMDPYSQKWTPKTISRDGRFRLGDEIINVNGKSLRGLTMDEAKGLLRTCGPEVDIILARDPDQAETVPTSSTASAAAPAPANSTSSTSGGPMGPVERRRRRKLPPIERPRSAPIHNLLEPESGLRTVIKIGSNSQSIEHHHHHVHHLGIESKKTPYIFPGKSSRLSRIIDLLFNFSVSFVMYNFSRLVK